MSSNDNSSISSLPHALFNTVAQNDFEGMVKGYASQSCDAIGSWFAMHRTHDSRCPIGAEEKRDDGEHHFYSPNSSLSTPSYALKTLHDLTNLIDNIERGIAMEMAAKEQICATAKKSQSSIKSHIIECHSSRTVTSESFKVRQKRSEPQRQIHSMWNPVQQKEHKRQKNLQETEIIGEDEVECYLFESSMVLSNSRPEPSFVVCKRMHDDEWGRKSEMRTIVMDAHGDMDQDCVMDEAIFDGAVANSTPIGTGFRRGSGGGLGTILHLACAIDSPFALALLLVMGANVSSFHTAFRRSIFHEAACSNSHECLRLLLDIGEGYYEYTKNKAATNTEKGERKATHGKVESVLGPWYKKKRPTPPASKLATEESNGGMNTIGKVAADWKDRVGLSYVSTLQKIMQLITKLRRKELSNFDAAQSLLSEVPLTKKSSAFIAACCGKYQFAQDVMNMNPGTSYLNADTYLGISLRDSKRNPLYDGRGNTPLHWAAFKNAAACVDLLLSYKADSNSVAITSGWTPLHDAAYSDSAESVKLLIAAGADVNAKANSGATPLCFAAQEDAPHAMRLLLLAGADAADRCCEHNGNSEDRHLTNRFSGYTPLHYCAHYNAYQAARVLLEMESLNKKSFKLQEIPDLNERLSIHIAVSRGSSDVLKELLHNGARLDTTKDFDTTRALEPQRPAYANVQQREDELEHVEEFTLEGHQSGDLNSSHGITSSDLTPAVVTPISSPVLQSMIPPEPIASSKPWNCLSQRSIDECRILLRDAELNWTPERHAIFHPSDRLAVLELLRVGKRLEQMNTGIFLELWPLVLSFCGRGWFEPNSSSTTIEHQKDDVNELMDFSLLDD